MIENEGYMSLVTHHEFNDILRCIFLSIRAIHNGTGLSMGPKVQSNQIKSPQLRVCELGVPTGYACEYAMEEEKCGEIFIERLC